MKNRDVLTEIESAVLVELAFNTYEMTADWADAYRAVNEWALDEFNKKPDLREYVHAVARAQVLWKKETIRVKKEIKKQAAPPRRANVIDINSRKESNA